MGYRMMCMFIKFDLMEVKLRLVAARWLLRHFFKFHSQTLGLIDEHLKDVK